MKVVLFCGGQGLRMRYDNGDGKEMPKPMVPLGARPILWHLMKYYAHFGHKEFILCLGYKGIAIKEFFAEYQEWVSNDFVINGSARIELMRSDMDDWHITLVDTGQHSSIGERLLAIRAHVQHEEIFLANYSDGLTDCPLTSITDHLKSTNAVAACMLARPNISLHLVDCSPAGKVQGIVDAAQANLWINAGFFAFRQRIFDYIRPGEDLVAEPLQRLIAEGSLLAHPHCGFWSCCDTFKDLQKLQSLLACGHAPWEVWRNAVLPTTADELYTHGRGEVC